MKKRVAIIGIMGLPAKYGGFETFAQFLVQRLSERFDFTVYCSGPDYKERPDSYLGAKLCYLPFRANGPQGVLFDGLSILHACLYSDVLLVLGSSGGLVMPIAKLFGKKIIFNQGALDWRRSKWGPKTQKILRFLESCATKGTTTLVCDNACIATYFRESYSMESHLIEYGGDQHPKPPLKASFQEQYPFVKSPYALALARIQPDNNVEVILEGFSKTPTHPLVFIGNWSNSEFGKEMLEKYKYFENIHMLQAIYDPEILNSFRAYCSLYVHGHSAGGTAPSLVEAMYFGLPVASFDVGYNRATTEDKALYFGDSTQLRDLLIRTSRETWINLGPTMKEIADRRYTWDIIANKYAELF